MMIFKLKILFLVVCLLACHANSFAGNNPVYANSLLGREDSITVNKEIVTTDLNYLSYKMKIEKTNFVKNLVLLGIDEESPFAIESDFEVTMTLEMTCKDAKDSVWVVQKDLKVKYSGSNPQTVSTFAAANSDAYPSMAYYTFNNAVEVKAKILTIQSNVSWNVMKVLKLKNEIAANRDYMFDCAADITSITLHSIDKGELPVSWTVPQNFATEYDVEWAWIEETTVASYTSNEQFFDHNATRITTSNPSTSIPLLYDGEGRIYVRVRPAQIKYDGQRIEGKWSYPTTPTNYTHFDGHETYLNWQATTSFAEEDKRKSVVKYFDGTLRARQTVTMDMTRDNPTQTPTVIAAETLYDYQGRPAIQVLPAPTINNTIGYIRNFNQFEFAESAKSAYDKISITSGACSIKTNGLLTGDGASKYYSPANPFANQGYNQYIPDAQKYPYTETRYTKDGTGRIDAQGGVGPDHQINSGHETKYLYESVDQDDLDALFGTDAGYASHYFKNWVKDANGQYSVNYTDMHGRTVATALAGAVPVNNGTNMVEKLPSYEAGKRMTTRQLIDDETNHVSGRSIISSKSLVVAKEGDYTFNYNLSPDKLRLAACSPKPDVCYDCLYDLKISIIPDCKEIVIQDVTNGTAVFTNPVTASNFTLGSYLNSCTGSKSPAVIKTFTLRLPEGSYTIVKELTLSADAQDSYRENVFLANNTCKTLTDFELLQFNLEDAEYKCQVNCKDCMDRIGLSLKDFKAKLIINDGLTPAEVAALDDVQIEAAYNQAKANCDKLCTNSLDDGFDEIRSIRQQMLSDMTPPNGQYALPANSNVELNIFNPFPTSAPYTNPFDANSSPTSYKDEYSKAVEPFTANVKGGLVGSTASQKEQYFVSNFLPAYAEQLLPHHPEYLKLVKTEKELKGAYAFEAQLMKVNTWAVAVSKGYLKTTTRQTDLLTLDPFFTGTGSSTRNNEMADAMNKMWQHVEYTCNGATTATTKDVSIWKMAQFPIFCRKELVDHPSTAPCNSNPDVDDCYKNNISDKQPDATTIAKYCDADLNLVWTNFRSFYLSCRKQMIAKYLDPNNAISNYITSIRSTPKPIYVPRFVVQSPSSTLPKTGDDMIDQLVQNNDVNAINGVMSDDADQNCRNNAHRWMSDLSQCLGLINLEDPDNQQTGLTPDGDWLVNNLVNVCKAGVDYMGHPNGASSLPAGTPDVIETGAFPGEWGSGTHFRNFTDIIAYYLQQKNIRPSAVCHQFLIGYPAAYENAPAVAEQTVMTKPSDCECNQIKAIKELYDQWIAGGNTGSFIDYLATYHGTVITQGDLQQLMDMCNGVQTNPKTCSFIAPPIQLPAIFQCRGSATPVKTCITCTDYSNLKDGFNAATQLTGPFDSPQNQDELDANLAFEKYANWSTGFQKKWTDYVAFGQQCAGVDIIPCADLQAALADWNAIDHVNGPPLVYTYSSLGGCMESFMVFMNDRFNKRYYYYQWINIFEASCGFKPNVCEPPVLTCTLLKKYISAFYFNNTPYPTPVWQHPNCQDEFVAYVNGIWQTQYTFAQLEAINESLCKGNCDLDICSFPNHFLLNDVYYAYLSWQQTHPVSGTTDCQNSFVTFFNAFFSLQNSNAWTWTQISDAYTNFPHGCVPDLSQLCNPPFSCTILNAYVTDFYRLNGGTGISYQPNCKAAFTIFFNQQNNTSYSFTDIAALYMNACNAPLRVCDPVIATKALLLMVDDYRRTGRNNPDSCESEFVRYFNLYYGLDYNFEAINEVYKERCGHSLTICDAATFIYDCGQLTEFLDKFTESHRNPYEEFGGDCDRFFTAYFNQQFSTDFDFDLIKQYYLVFVTKLNVHF